MSQPSGNGAVRAKPDALSSLAGRLPDPQDREWFASLVSYVDSLPPNDEFVKIAQLFGFLTLIGRELPEHLAQERGQLRELLVKARADFLQQIKTNASYHDKLTERLNKLPEEIAEGVKPDAIAKTMSEAFRQQITATGLQDTKAFLTATTSDLKKVTRELDAVVQPITTRYGSLAAQIEKQVASLDYESGKLTRTNDTLKSKNAELLREVQSLHWYYYLATAMFLLLLGGFLGATWEHRKIGGLVLGLQDQVVQLQQTIKTPDPLIPPAATIKHSKKNKGPR
jgi:hypothetical protein